MGFQPYRTTFSRHLHSMVQNGFFARTMDADDYAFLERFRQPRTRSWSVSSSISHGGWEALHDSAPSDPTLFSDPGLQSWWEKHWDEEDAINERRRQWYAEKADRRAAAAARVTPRAAQLKEDREAKAEALAAEQAAWDMKQQAKAEERERRLLKTMLSDLEWEASELEPDPEGGGYLPRDADEKKRVTSFRKALKNGKKVKGGTKGTPGHSDLYVAKERHYIPFWKREQIAAEKAAAKAAREARAAAKAAQAAHKEAQARARATTAAQTLAHQQAVERHAAAQARAEQAAAQRQALAEQQARAREAQLMDEAAKRRQHAQDVMQAAAAERSAEQAAAEWRARISAGFNQEDPAIMAAQRRRAAAEERERQAKEQAANAAAEAAEREARVAMHRTEHIKHLILYTIRARAPQMVTVEELMEICASDRQTILRCANELVGGGYLRSVG